MGALLYALCFDGEGEEVDKRLESLELKKMRAGFLFFWVGTAKNKCQFSTTSLSSFTACRQAGV